MPKYSISILLVLLLVSCNKELAYSEFQPIANGKWPATDTLEFQVSNLDSLQRHNMFINVRNNDAFPFSNLFLITEFEHPRGETVRDTLEYEMAKPNGEWLGTGHGSIKESKLWYRENVVFRDTGVYKVRVMHAMRKNGSVEGLEILEGITDVGLEIVKSKK
ncbi:gliding motility lipoprotein GldH [Flagellimonas lutaonensis]|uniref:Gliding motility-associated lipoprotein GldH n=1 Tax=Flagellimonas lutaonensis TaxID=516051 RepID=A0A0D5YS00_9FLAO|nr:gliding motility lipoprotein GldH [Allomuricauda lutaonensis]AKA35052.1 Gliding motility-associated lipoprotein GldH [Allomuricauda lutaonensis]